MSRRRLFAIAALFLALGGCAKKEDAGVRSRADAAASVDVDVMAFLSEARALHHEANVREDQGDVEGAVAAMRRLVVAQAPHAGQTVPEVEEVLADAFARMAELEVKARRFDEATRAVEQGLRHAPEATYFRGHLLEVQGVLEEARASDLADAGKKEEAEKARTKAITLLEQAVRVQEQVISRTLADGGAR